MTKHLPKSEIERQEIIRVVTHWAETTKVMPYLRVYDIPSLASSILGIFYHITLCCGHKVGNFDDGVKLEMDDYSDGEHGISVGIYCKECADEYLEEGFARKPKC